MAVEQESDTKPALDLLVRYFDDGRVLPHMRSYGFHIPVERVMKMIGLLAAHVMAACWQEPENVDDTEDRSPSYFVDELMKHLNETARDEFWNELTSVTLRDPHDPDREAIQLGTRYEEHS